MMKKILVIGISFAFFYTSLVADDIVKTEGLLRYWKFDNGSGDEVTNYAPSPASRRAMTGGPLGSLQIVHETPWGIILPYVRITRQGEIESRWIKGRYPGKSALRVGTYTKGAFRSGLDGTELTNGFTFAMWVRPIASTNKVDRAVVARMGDAWMRGFNLTLTSYGRKEKAFFEARFALGPGKDGNNEFVIMKTGDLDIHVWHYVAITWDGRETALYLNGVEKARREMTKPFIPHKFTSSWTAYMPFFEDNDRGAFSIGGRSLSKSNAPFDIGMFAVFNRALDEAQLAKVAGRRAEGTVAEQVAAANAETAKLLHEDSIRLAFPSDTAGYFRINEKFNLSLAGKGLSGYTLYVKIETLQGKTLLEKKVMKVDKDTGLDFPVSFDRCGVYLVTPILYDKEGNELKRPYEPISIGVVPKKPAKVDSPLGFWAMHEYFSFDTNLRRVAFDSWGKLPATREEWTGYKTMHNRVKCYLEKQRIAKEELRMYSFLPHLCTKSKTLPQDKIAELKTKLEWAAQTAKELGIKEFEVTSEVDGRTTPEAYIENLKIIAEILPKYVPDAKLYPPGGTPCSLPFIEKIFALGATNYSYGVSHHNYIANPLHWYRWGDLRHRFDAFREKYRQKNGEKLHLYNTETMIASLPRVQGRMMTRAHARQAGIPVNNTAGLESFTTSTPEQPENDAGAYQAQAAMLNLLAGFESFVFCGSGIIGNVPSLWGVAVTALSGQVLNGYESAEEISLSSLDSMCMRLRRKDGSSVVALFGNETATFSFLAPPGAEFRTMDLYGNFSSVKVSANGILTLTSGKDPQYIFNLPESFKPVKTMSLKLPDVMSENGKMTGELEITNPLKNVIEGKLRVVEKRGMSVTLSESTVSVEPGGRKTIAVDVLAKGLKKRLYSVRIDLLGNDGQTVSSVEKIFESRGIVHVVPRLEKPMPLDGDTDKWKNIPAAYCDTNDDVVHGKQNLAELWLPQWRGTDDLSLKLRMGYVKDDAIYFMLEVKDDVVYPSPDGRRVFLYDSLELFVDTRTGKSLGSNLDVGAQQAIIPATTSAKTVPVSVLFAKPGEEHVKIDCVSRKTENGYLLEGRIAPNEKCQIKFRPGTSLLMDFLVDDADSDKKLRKAAMAFHGLFNNNSNVSAWGRYELGL